MPVLYINSLDDEPGFERCETFSGGVDDYTRSTLLPQDASQSLVNLISDESGELSVRPGVDPLGAVLSASQRIPQLVYFDTPSLERVYASINNSLRSWDGVSWTTIGAYPFGANTISAMAQGSNLLFCSDGTNQWQTWDGAAWSGALGAGATDPPVGANKMIWHTERMFAVKPTAYDTIYTSDIGSAGTGNWPVANQFRVGRGEGDPIKALLSFKTFYLVVLKEASIYLVDADPTITVANWSVVRLSNSIGCVGGAIAFADQIMFLSRDGIRAITATEGSDTPYEVSPPLSQPVNSWIKRINWEYAYKTVAHRYGAFVLFAIPVDSNTEPSHVLVFNLRTGKWSGVWTGWYPTAFATSRFSGVERLLFGDKNGFVQQWKDYTSVDLASTYQDNGAEIAASWYSRGMNFGEPVNWKDPTWAEWRFINSLTNVDLKIYLDGQLERTFTASTTAISNSLPVDLPFDLASLRPVTIAKRLDGLTQFNEAFLSTESTSGKWILKNATMSAFLNTHQDE
jgi:hypothetical protein